ncbi:MAG: hypothetical protein SGJ03_03770 [Alphaproteobacteria bacterium]|nr:hypothetical protein [Alphaproteobacteria bacterium]
MRSIAFLFVLVQGALLGPLYMLYGQIDPCRALAADIALRAEKAGGVGVVVDQVFGDLEINARRDISDRSTLRCASELIGNWTGTATGT